MEKPNIILITFDSTRADRLGVAGYKKKITPFLDSLAKKSAYFKKAFATGPGSPHSFVAILTSTFPFDYGGFEYIDRPRVLLSEVLKSNGYQTIAVHSAAYMSEYFGYNRGWDKFLYLSHFKDGEIMAGMKPGTWQTKIIGKIDATRFWLTHHLPWAKWFFTLFEKMVFGVRKMIKDLTHYNFPFYVAEEINEEVRKILPEKTKDPLFLWVHYMDPHGPYGLFLKRSRNILNKIKFHLIDFLGYFCGELFPFINKWFVPFHARVYDASIKYTDKNIENLFKYLSSIDIINNESIVVICSDHGEEFFEHGWVGHEATLWNVNLNVPLIFYSKKHIPPKIINYPVSLIDISSTILEVAKLPKENSFKGDNLFTKTNRPIIGQVPYTAADLSDQKFLGATIIHRGYKLINMLGKKKMLFSMENDFEEKNNLYEKEKEIATRLEQDIKPYESILSSQ